MRPEPGVEVGSVRPAPGEVALDRGQRVAVLQARPHRGDQRRVAVGTGELGHPFDHATAQPLPLPVGRDHDLERAENGRLAPLFREAGFEHGADPLRR